MPAFRGSLASSFWGRAWCDNLESYSDFSNRLPRGRSYVRGGAVVDLQIAEAQVRAKVQGTRLYTVEVDIRPVSHTRLSMLLAACADKLATLKDLLAATLPDMALRAMCDRDSGLFPQPNEIEFRCSCPDWASMCKHVAAVLYGVGARLDDRPELLFLLRGADPQLFIHEAARTTVDAATALPVGVKLLDDASVHALFGIDLEPPPKPAVKPPPKPAEGTAAPKPRPTKKPASPPKTGRPAAAPASALSGLEAALCDALLTAFSPNAPPRRRTR